MLPREKNNSWKPYHNIIITFVFTLDVSKSSWSLVTLGSASRQNFLSFSFCLLLISSPVESFIPFTNCLISAASRSKDTISIKPGLNQLYRLLLSYYLTLLWPNMHIIWLHCATTYCGLNTAFMKGSSISYKKELGIGGIHLIATELRIRIECKCLNYIECPQTSIRSSQYGLSSYFWCASNINQNKLSFARDQ